MAWNPHCYAEYQNMFSLVIMMLWTRLLKHSTCFLWCDSTAWPKIGSYKVGQLPEGDNVVMSPCHDSYTIRLVIKREWKLYISLCLTATPQRTKNSGGWSSNPPPHPTTHTHPPSHTHIHTYTYKHTQRMKNQRLKAVQRLKLCVCVCSVRILSDCVCIWVLSVRVFHSSDSLTIGKWPTSLPLFISPSICLFLSCVSCPVITSLHWMTSLFCPLETPL